MGIPYYIEVIMFNTGQQIILKGTIVKTYDTSSVIVRLHGDGTRLTTACSNVCTSEVAVPKKKVVRKKKTS